MADEGDDEWKFSVDEVGDDADDGTGQDGADEAGGNGTDAAEDEDDAWGTTIGADDDGPTVTVGDQERAGGELQRDEADGEGNVAGALSPGSPVQAGTPDLENVVFVSTGVIATVLVFTSLVVPDPLVLGGVGLAVLAACATLYAFFTRY